MSGLYSMPRRASAALRRGDDGAAVARTEVHQEVLRCELRQIEHLVDQGLRRRHPHDVLAGLADLWLERLGGRLGLGRSRGGGQEKGPQEEGTKAPDVDSSVVSRFSKRLGRSSRHGEGVDCA